MSAASIKRVAMTALVALPTFAATAAPPTQPPATPPYSQQDLLKNWAFSVCLATVSKDAATRADAHAAAGAYLAQGKQDVVAYDKLRKFVDAFAARRSNAEDPSTMKCIDLLRSAELDRLSAKLARMAK